MNNKFCHLHVHDEYSILDGYGKADRYAKYAAELGFKYLGLTNHGNVDGLIKFQKNCFKNGITPIMGCEFYIVPDATQKIKGEKSSHIVLFAKDDVGFQNIMKMLTYANLEGFYYRPRIDIKTLKNNLEGIVITSACASSFINSEWGKELMFDIIDEIRDDFYLEVMPHEFDKQIEHNRKVIELAERCKIPIVATNDCHYIEKDDERVQEILLSIQTKDKISNPERYQFSIKTLYVKTYREMMGDFARQGVLTRAQVSVALGNTLEVAEKCEKFKIERRKVFLPAIRQCDNKPREFFWNLCLRGLRDKGFSKNDFYKERMKEEFEVITRRGFEKYFLIVWDIVNFCRNNDILVGPGRGSVGGSLIAYLIGITMVDPIKYGLLFSRFISETREDLPDIDMDFEDIKRPMIREYLQSIYGADHVAGISTFLSMKGRMAFRDVCRVFDVNPKEVDVISKLIDVKETGFKETWEKIDECKAFKDSHPEIVNLSLKLEDQVRSEGQHPAGIIVSQNSLYTGINTNIKVKSDLHVVNWDKEDAEFMGMIKLDILGLNALTILSEIRRLVKQNTDKTIRFENIELEDQKTLLEFTEGNTTGCFQFGSYGMRRLCKDLVIESFDDLVMTTSLFRPAPLQVGIVDEVIKRKHGLSEIRYYNEKYKNITKNTYGMLVYQEQIMLIISEIGGISLGIADNVRKATEKSDVEKVKVYRNQFIEGCVKNKELTEEEASKLWSEIEALSGYAFNRAHAVEYTIISYWDMWLKMHYPLEFICANLTYGAEDKKAVMIDEAKRLGIKIELPDRNKSDSTRWSIKEGKLYCPFIEIKGVGEKTAEKIFSESSSEKGFFSKKAVSSKVTSILDLIDKYKQGEPVDISGYFSFDVNTKTVQNSITPGMIKRVEFLNPDVRKCKDCELRKECIAPSVPTKGKFNVMIVGEAPGPEENKRGICFCGKAGQKMWTELKTHDLFREYFHVTNVCKCYPSITRTPSPSHMKACSKWLIEEFDKIKPTLVLSLGNTPLSFFKGGDFKITHKNASIEWIEKYKAWFVWSVHPSYILRNPSEEPEFQKSIKLFADTFYDFYSAEE